MNSTKTSRVQTLPPWSSLVALQPNGTKPPFFWVHGQSSNAFLPRYLAPDQPVYGFSHQSLDGKPARYTTVEEIAAYYLNELLTVQSEGPFFLGGYCFGALVAFEIAQQLYKQDQKAALVLLLEVATPPTLKKYRNGTGSTELLRRHNELRSVRSEVLRHLSNLERLKPKERVSYLLARVSSTAKNGTVHMTGAATNRVKTFCSKICLRLNQPLPVSLRSHYILGVYERAVSNYVPVPYPGRVTLFKCADATASQFENWESLAMDGLDIYTVPGNHARVLEEPNVRVWAEQLKTCLELAGRYH